MGLRGEPVPDGPEPIKKRCTRSAAVVIRLPDNVMAAPPFDWGLKEDLPARMAASDKFHDHPSLQPSNVPELPPSSAAFSRGRLMFDDKTLRVLCNAVLITAGGPSTIWTDQAPALNFSGARPSGTDPTIRAAVRRHEATPQHAA